MTKQVPDGVTEQKFRQFSRYLLLSQYKIWKQALDDVVCLDKDVNRDRWHQKQMLIIT